MEPTSPTLAEMLRHGAFLRGVVRGLVRDEASAEDVVQETWVRALERPPRHGGNVRGWLGVVARNVAFRSRRGETRRTAREQAAARVEAQEPSAANAALLAWQRRVVEAVEALDTTHRHVIVARFYEDLGPRQIAARLGVTGTDVARLQQEALERIARHLDQRAHGGRREWTLALLPLVDPRTSAAATAGAATGGAVMGSKVVVAGLVVVAAGTGWTLRQWTYPSHPGPPAAEAAAAPPVDAPRLEGRASRAAPAAAPVVAADLPAKPAARRPLTAEEWLQRIQQADPGVAAVVEELRGLPAEEGWEVFRTIYARINPVGRREKLAKAIQGSGYRYEIAVLDLAANDADPERARETREWLGRYALRNFDDDAEGVEGYRRWADAHRTLSVPDAVASVARAWVERLRAATGKALSREFRNVRDLLDMRTPGVAAALREAGLKDLLASWRGRTELPSDAHRASIRWLLPLGEDPATVASLATAIVRDPGAHPQGLRHGAYEVLPKSAPESAAELLASAYEKAPEKRDWWEISRALVELRDPRVLPTMVAMIVADGGTYDSAYGIGYFGLSKWLGVSYDKEHDGRWWERWWADNADRVPEPARGKPLPVLRPVAR